MVNENKIPIEVVNKKPVETVAELKEVNWWTKNPIKKSNLSKSAQDLVNRKSGSEYVSENKEGYGPMGFTDEALQVAQSYAIMNRIRNEFPNVASLLDWKREATLGFLKANGALSGYRVNHTFYVPFRDDYSKDGPTAWANYRNKIESYTDDICAKVGPQFREELREARKALTDYIHKEYYDLLPKWPSVGQVNVRGFEANVGGSYPYGSSKHIVWNCLGWITVTDRHPVYMTFEAEFSGSPEIKVLVLNVDKMKEIEEDAKYNFEGAKRRISGGESRYRQIDWDSKYV